MRFSPIFSLAVCTPVSGNTFGLLFTVTSFGESHGPALGCIADGCPPGLALTEADIQRDLERRRPGRSRYTSQRREPDQVRILSGVFEGETTGTPIMLLVENQDQRPKDYAAIRELLRPNHADYAYLQKYGRRDYRGSGRASARETVARVAAGAIARKYLAEQCGIQVRGCLVGLGPLSLEVADWNAVEDNPFFCPDPKRLAELEDYMAKLAKEGDSIGAEILVEARCVPPGLGEPVYSRLDADLAAAMMSINAVKGVAVGDGFEAARQRGTEHRDEMSPEGFYSNHAGGIVGGISTGQDILLRIALKPTSSIRLPARSVDVSGRSAEVATKGRHDPCVGLRAVPIAEAMLALVLMDHFLRNRAQNIDVQPGMAPLPASADPSR